MTVLALAGNPNCGKTTVFNALTGSHHHVGNWPGVTVTRRSGFTEIGGWSVEVVDLPGTYSLAAQSEDERIAADFLSDPAVDLIINVLDASNLERNLYLTSQLMELGKPMVFALNMMDDAESAGTFVDVATLQMLLGAPVVPTVGNRAQGIQELRDVINAVTQAKTHAIRTIHVPYGDDIERELAKLQGEISRDEELVSKVPSRCQAVQLLEGSPSAQAKVERSHACKAITAQLRASLAFLEPHLGADGPTLVAERRYGFAHGLVMEVVDQKVQSGRTVSDRLDAVLTHRWLGIPIFIAVMMGVYALTFIAGKPPQDWIASGFTMLHDWAAAGLPPGELSSLLVDGIIPGVGAVVVFVPVIMLLMGCISFLEDSGYMARGAFIMDRAMHLMGLHGKSFIPLVMGTGCNVPAVQATRTIEARADRFITILVSPLVSCSARLQVYIILAGAFFPPVQAAFVLIALHFLGFALAMIMGKILRLTLFRGDNSPFVMELPPYRMPVMKSAFIHMWEKGSVFLSRAGTTILAGATIIWFVSHYPGISNQSWRLELQAKRQAIQAEPLLNSEKVQRLDVLDRAHQSRILDTSLAAHFGKALQPILAPILDPDRQRPEAWKDGVALTAGFAAKEIVVSTLAVMHQAKAAETIPYSHRSHLQDALRTNSGMRPLTALAFMILILIYTPCIGTVSMIFKETRSLGWTTFTVAYGLVLAWVTAWGTVTVGRMMGM
jgi:ferrous iron transport protein B